VKNSRGEEENALELIGGILEGMQSLRMDA